MLYPQYRHAMVWASVFTTPFGLTEPLFVPEYWSPPSLFDLAISTGFDVESLIFCFGIGGVGAVSYNILTGKLHKPLSMCERNHESHRFHLIALASPFVVFLVTYFMPWNPIYPSILAMFVGAAATVYCRYDLKVKVCVGGALFLIYYAVFLLALEWSAPGYIERVWDLDALSGVIVFSMPLEELLFALGFGMYWSGVYEHFTWREPANI